MIDKDLIDAGFPVVVTNRWRRRRAQLDPQTIVSIRQKITDREVVDDATLGAWVRESGKVWLLNPDVDPFTIVVEAPPRGRASSEAEAAVLALVQAICDVTDAVPDKRSAIPLVEKSPTLYAPPDSFVIEQEEDNDVEENVEE